MGDTIRATVIDSETMSPVLLKINNKKPVKCYRLVYDNKKTFLLVSFCLPAVSKFSRNRLMMIETKTPDDICKPCDMH